MELFNGKKINIQVTESFADSASRLSKDIKTKLTNVQTKLFNNPNAKGLNLEKVNSTNENVYSIRVDDNYRIILLYPNSDNNLFIFLYVSTHDDAYKWAKNFKYGINKNGGIQIYTKASDKTSVSGAGLKLVPKLADIPEECLEYMEIPRPYWEALKKGIYTKKQLAAYSECMSDAAMIILEGIFDGLPIESIKENYDSLTHTYNIELPEPLFQKYSNSDLSKIGVPDEYIETVKAIKFNTDLNDLQTKLPKDAVQGLYSLLSGESIDNIVKISNSGSKQTEDLVEALENANSKAVVTPIKNIEEFTQMLEYPMEKWRLFLHPQQRSYAYRHYNGPARILGGAGTGKTVINIHHAKFLAQECNKDEAILVTTYSSTLAKDIEKRLDMICTDEERDKIIVINIDKLVIELAKEAGYYIKYPGAIDYKTKQDLFELLWDTAKYRVGNNDYDNEFLQDEWIYVIQSQNIQTKEEYLNASRMGRGKKLNSKAREIVWQICEEYKKQIEEKKDVDIDYAENKIASIALSNNDFCKFKSIIIDECQDLRAPAIRMLRAITGNSTREDDLFFAGDTRQSIYNKGRYNFSQCGVAINNRSTLLKLNYRTTKEIYDLAYKIQKTYDYDDLDGEITEHDKSVCVYHGEKPSIKGFSSVFNEMKAVFDDIKHKISIGFSPEEICIVARQSNTVSIWDANAQNYGVKTLYLKRGVIDDKSNKGVRVATMHRVKGMEFDCMYVIGINSNVMPLAKNLQKAEGQEEIDEIIKQEANILSVAITRARKTAWISYNGEPSEYLTDLDDNE